MTEADQGEKNCWEKDKGLRSCDAGRELPMLVSKPERDEVCCGTPPGPASNLFEKPGYEISEFVEDFRETVVGLVPRVKTVLEPSDIRGAVSVRLGFGRNHYKVSPGLYCVGKPDADAPVLVTANYKLSFDALRKELDDLDAWIMVLDTRGVNVWCAAGKGTFSTEEVIRLAKSTGLDKVVRHRRLILPQLSATGVSAKLVKKGCGFRVKWGPVRAGNLKKFLAADMQTDRQMRQVTFSFLERLVLVPVELHALIRYVLWAVLALFLMSGLGPGIFALDSAWNRGLVATLAVSLGVFSGAIMTPLLLPWIPGRAFSVKGLLAGLLLGVGVLALFSSEAGLLGVFALLLLAVALSSHLAMNFTGATPFTSPSGVEKEMRRAIPFQAGAAIIGAFLWVGSAFAG